MIVYRQFPLVLEPAVVSARLSSTRGAKGLSHNYYNITGLKATIHYAIFSAAFFYSMRQTCERTHTANHSCNL